MTGNPLGASPCDWSHIYLTHAAAIHAYIANRVADADTVDDLTALVFLRAIEAERRGAGCVTHMRGWLFRIAHNVVVDHFRWHHLRQHADVDAYPHLPNPAASPVEALDAAELVAVVERLLDRLTPAQACAIRLYWLDELPLSIIAARMGRNVPAVKALIHRGALRARYAARSLAAGCGLRAAGQKQNLRPAARSQQP